MAQHFVSESHWRLRIRGYDAHGTTAADRGARGKKVYRVGSVDVHALRGVNLTIEAGELCCILGRSGSGKSTLLNVLAGLNM